MSRATAIDLFAGAGGFSTGALQAGLNVRWAANHWPDAVQVHATNHPHAKHLCQDLHQADWSLVPAHDVMLASPACTGHTKARGKERSHYDAARSTAWAVVSCAEYHRPEVVIVENVPEFVRKWALYPAWKQAMELLGYTLTANLLDAADVGVPQHRKRMFVVATKGKHGITVKPGTAAHRTARSIIDWDSGSWGPVSHRRGGPGPADGSRAPATLARIAAAKERFGDRCLIGYYGADKGRSLDVPLGSVTTHDRFALVDNDRMRLLTIQEYRRAMGFPAEYQLTGRHTVDMKLLGNAVPPPLAAHVIGAVLQ